MFSIQGFIVGIAIGFFMLLILLVSGLLLWRRYKLSLRERMRPADLNLSVPTTSGISSLVGVQPTTTASVVMLSKDSSTNSKPELSTSQYGTILSPKSSTTGIFAFICLYLWFSSIDLIEFYVISESNCHHVDCALFF
jgi:hypothetical protein